MKKVLFVATVDSHIQHFHIPYLKLFKEKGYEVHVATNGVEKIDYCDVKHTVTFERSPFKANNIKAIKQLKKIINKEKYEIIHCHTPMGGVVTRLAAKKSRKVNGTKVIYTAHGFHFFKGASKLNWLLFYPIEKHLAKFTDELITINNEDYELAKAKFKTNVHYVPGVGIDKSKFDFKMTKKEKSELRKSLGLKDSDYVLIYPAELSYRKNQTMIINAMKKLVTENNNIHVLLPGKDSFGGKHKELVEQLNISENIHFLGYRNDINKLLKISNLAVSTARQEGLPVNLLEAMASGLNLVVTRCRGNKDLVLGRKDSYVVEIDDVDGFVSMIKKSYESKTSREQRDIFEFEFSNILNKYYDIYDFNKKKKLVIVTSGFLPIPATKGGAAENLIDTVLEQNELYKKMDITVFSSYDEKAVLESKKYTSSKFVYFKSNIFASLFDKTVYFFIDKVFKKRNSRKFRFFLQRIDFFNKCSKNLNKNSYNKVLLENHTIMYLTLKMRKNYLKYKDNYYYHCHNVVPSLYGMDEIIKKTKHFISVSQFREKYLIDFFGVDHKQSSVVLNCCSTDINQIITEQEKNNLKSSLNIGREKIILYVGRVDEDKGVLELINACEKLNDVDFKLLIVGAPIFGTGIHTEYEEKVKSLIKKNNEKYIMTGYVKHSELYKYYSIADVVVIPSQVEDSAPLVLIESLASGKAVVATMCGGIPEYATPECAYMVKNDKDFVENLCFDLKKVLTNDNIRSKMEIESKKRSKLYTPKKYYFDFIDKLLDE